MLIYETKDYEYCYFKALKELTNDRYLVFNDEKICYEASAIFMFDYVYDALKIVNNNFLSNYDYNKIKLNGNQYLTSQLEYFSSCILQNGQLQKVIENIKKKPYTKQALITLPKSNLFKMPCMMYIYFRVINNALYCSAHMRANNAYGLSIINMHINNALCIRIANELSIRKIYYKHIVDSFHLYKREIEEVNSFIFNNGLRLEDVI